MSCLQRNWYVFYVSKSYFVKIRALKQPTSLKVKMQCKYDVGIDENTCVLN